MEVNDRVETEERKIIEVEGVEFYVEDLVQPLGWIRHDSIKDDLVDSSVLRRMERAGLVKKTGGSHPMIEEVQPVKWKDVDGKCRELFEKLNEPYYRLRPKVKIPTPSFGMWDEQEDENAREKAEEKLEKLQKRNPDVEFYLDEEKINSIPTS